MISSTFFYTPAFSGEGEGWIQMRIDNPVCVLFRVTFKSHDVWRPARTRPVPAGYHQHQTGLSINCPVPCSPRVWYLLFSHSRYSRSLTHVHFANLIKAFLKFFPVISSKNCRWQRTVYSTWDPSEIPETFNSRAYKGHGSSQHVVIILFRLTKNCYFSCLCRVVLCTVESRFF